MESRSRRIFLKEAGLTMGCLALSLPEALAQARRAQKPLLTEANLNQLVAEDIKMGANKGALMAKMQRRKEVLALAQEFKADPKAFLNNHFFVTQAQQSVLNKLTAADIKTLAD